MAAATVASPNCHPSSAFSPIALFECTISNAQMLVESMELCDLVAALKIVSQLHGRVVEIMEPSASRAQQLAELYGRHAADIERLAAGHKPPEEAEADSSRSPAVEAPVKREIIGLADSEEDDMEMFDLEETVGYWPETTPVRSRSQQQQLPQEQLQQHQQQQLSQQQQQQQQAPKDANSKPLSENWKLLLRKAYRGLKAEGRQLFDFSKSYSAPVNLEAAETIISRAMAMSSKPPLDAKCWKDLEPCSLDQCRRYLSDYYRMTLKKPSRTQLVSKQTKKLSRRQRSFENMLEKGALTPIEKTKMQAILKKDYTSSDEEEPDGWLRAKQLTWETPEVTRLKSMLDRHFSEVIANPRERQELRRLRRGGASCRGPPENAVDWAVNWPPAADPHGLF